MKRVLIVDDAPFMRSALGRILKEWGFEVAGEASNAISAVKLYKELNPDIVTLDITLPESSGLETIRMIKVFDENARIIVISAMKQEYMVREAILAGAAAYIIKPFGKEKPFGLSPNMGVE